MTMKTDTASNEDNPLAVRWDTEHEEADVGRLFRVVGDDFAIALDRNGWEIRMKRACHPGPTGTVDGKWYMRWRSAATPAWAFDDVGPPERDIDCKPYPSAEDLILGWAAPKAE
jgi:hypothetical protein